METFRLVYSRQWGEHKVNAVHVSEINIIIVQYYQLSQLQFSRSYILKYTSRFFQVYLYCLHISIYNFLRFQVFKRDWSLKNQIVLYGFPHQYKTFLLYNMYL